MCVFERLRQLYIFNGSAIFYFLINSINLLKFKKGKRRGSNITESEKLINTKLPS